MNVSINFQDYDVVSSGCVISPESGPIMFKIDDLEFHVLFDQTNSDSEVDKRVYTRINKPEDDAKGIMEIHMAGLNNSLFASIGGMLSLATYGKRELFLKFAVTSFNRYEDTREDKLFYYTWYLKKETNGGEEK